MTYPFLTGLRLDVEDPSLLPAGSVVSQIRNPNGREGGWGWITPTVGRAYGITASTSPLKYLLVFESPGGASTFYSESAPVTAGTPYSASWATEATPPAYYYRGSLVFLDAAGATVSTVATAITTGGSGTDPTLSTTVPTGATRVRLAFDLYGTAAGANPTTTTRIYLRDVKTGATSDLAKIQQAPLFRNLLTSATSISVDREDLNVGTLTATIPDATYDPSLNALLRPGRIVQLTAVSPSGSTSRSFTGRLSAAQVKYDPTIPGPKRAQITLNAVDAVSGLANVSRPDGVALIPQLRAVLEGAGVPWRINNDTGQIPPVAPITRNESATVLDQVAITRDSRHGYAWMDAAGTFRAYDAFNMPSLTVATLAESDYSRDIDISFDTERLINVVTIRLMRVNAATGETVEVPYGPYQRQASVDQWGPRSAEFTVHGLEDSDTAMRAFAEEVFNANATPQVVVNGVTLKVEAYDDPGRRLDLYDKVRIINTAAGIDQSPRVSKISHRITPAGWLVDVGFARDGGVAAPQVTPPLPSGGGGGASPASPRQQTGLAASGTFTVGTSKPITVTFPVEFASVPHVFGAVRSSASDQFSAVSVSNQTTTGCTLNVTRTSGTGSVNLSWVAVV